MKAKGRFQNDIGNEKAPTTIVAAISGTVRVYPMNVPVRPPEGGLEHPSIIKTGRIKEAAVEFIVQYHDGFFEVETFGDAEVEKFRDVLEALVTHEKWKPGTPFLINHAHLNSAPLTTDDMRKIARLNEQYRAELGKSKCAHFLARDLEFGMARMWEAFVENEWDVSEKLFKSRDDAIAWLSG